jgi:hypothetical protein
MSLILIGRRLRRTIVVANSHLRSTTQVRRLKGYVTRNLALRLPSTRRSQSLTDGRLINGIVPLPGILRASIWGLDRQDGGLVVAIDQINQLRQLVVLRGRDPVWTVEATAVDVEAKVRRIEESAMEVRKSLIC